jgi:guanylate kinase
MTSDKGRPIRYGRLFVIAAPSGAGKTSLVNALLARRPELRVSISHTTRKARDTEREGREYYFVPAEAFETAVAEGQFLEHAHVFGNHYGTARRPVEHNLAEGRDVVLEIDWQGARQVRASMPGAITIFILPPSRGALETRLRARQTDTEEVIAHRLGKAVDDMSHWREFDYIVVNDSFERAVSELLAIVDGQAEGLRANRPELATLLKNLDIGPA